ncbi:hypothetical protein [Streptomyces californicus]|uniref:hypothetical protein n=1 Tax=Streptomyces TaxID=1883 RepID=UPI0033D74587
MTSPTCPSPDVLLTRLARGLGLAPPPAHPPGEEYLHELSRRSGLRDHDLLLIAGLPLPEGALDLEGTAGIWVPSLVQHALSLAPADRRRLRERVRATAGQPRPARPLERPPAGPGPAGFGSLLVYMLALRNLGPSAVASAMYLVSDVCRAASTIRRIRDGVTELDAELLRGFAAVLGVPVSVLAALTGVSAPAPDDGLSPDVAEAAELVWEVRHFTEPEVRELVEWAEELGRA